MATEKCVSMEKAGAQFREHLPSQWLTQKYGRKYHTIKFDHP